MTMNGMHGQQGVETIPTFEVVELESMLSTSDELPDPQTLVSGFAIVDNKATPLFNRIHRRHALAARQLLERTQILGDELQVQYEGQQQNGPYSPPHVDGLVGRYYQVHTTIPEKPDVCSDAVVDYYDLSAREHEALRQLLHDGVGRAVSMRVHCGGQYRQTLYPALGDRTADSSWSRRALWGTSLVFPNGYDARPDTSPGRLYMHSFRTGRTSAENEEAGPPPKLRRAQISRIQRAEDSRVFEARGPKRSWLLRRRASR